MKNTNTNKIVTVVTYNDASAEMKLILSDNKGRYYSTKSSVCGFVKDANSIVSNRVKELKKLSPWWVTGFTDAEGCFMLSIYKSSNMMTGWIVVPTFTICINLKDRALLEQIKSFLGGVGNITKHGKDSIQLRVTSIKELEVIKNHFDNYPLITQKKADFEVFKQAVELVISKKHLTKEGLQEIVNIRASMNLGLSDTLKGAFPNTIPGLRSVVTNQKIQDPQWLAGFSAGEGCFLIKINKSSMLKLGEAVQLKCQITQHIRDEELLRSLVSYSGCGLYRKRAGTDAGDYVVTRFCDVVEKIIPFFDKYQILGAKRQDYLDFKRVAELMKEKAHLTASGLEQIKQIKAGMNRGRID